MKTRYIFFDLEGPLSPRDNAFDLMRHAGAGDIFRLTSRYDDLLALEGRAGYEAGDTLALIVPFLIRHGVTEADIEREAKLDAERCTLQFAQASTRRLDCGKRPIEESPLFGGSKQEELF